MVTGIIKHRLKKERKCGGCNWTTGTIYTLNDEPTSEGVCAECFLDGLIDYPCGG